MKAITYNEYGPPEVLKLTETDPPVLKAKEILIKVHAAEATKADCELRSFRFPVNWFWLPLRLAMGMMKPRRQILGGYFAGKIVKTGDQVTRFRPGEEVFGCARLRMGAYGQYMCLPANYTIETKPKNLSFEAAAAVPLGGLNALHFIRKAKIKTGDKVLINGAGGSIGTFAVQIAKDMGAEVTAVDSGIKEDMLRQIGADHFINYSQTDYTRHEKKYQVILNMVAKTSYHGAINSLEKNGCYLMANPRLSDMIQASITSIRTGKRVVFAFAGETQKELLTLKDMIEQGRIKPVVAKVFNMDQGVEAHRMVETEQRLGCVVIKID